MSGWYGVDLDGTLAHYEGWKGAEHIGEPVPAMMQRVRQWLSEGKQVKIVTARASDPHGYVRQWLDSHGLDQVEVTDRKDFGMIELWDDRVVQVEKNTGRELVSELRGWVHDLQSGMYINCVYCGHRYGPEDEVPATMADALKDHIEQCPDHPMSKLKEENRRLRKQLEDNDVR